MVIPATIDELVESAVNAEISYRNMHGGLLMTDSLTEETIRVPINSLFGKYRYFLENTIIEWEFNDIEFERYKYKPKALSDKLYGTTEFWSGLLDINECVSVIDFNSKKIKMYDPKKIKPLINEILIMEKVIT